jgi:hypothetical protein
VVAERHDCHPASRTNTQATGQVSRPVSVASSNHPALTGN